MALITYVAEDNPTILCNLIESLRELASVEVSGSGATEAEATNWLSQEGGRWNLAILACSCAKARAWASWPVAGTAERTRRW